MKELIIIVLYLLMAVAGCACSPEDKSPPAGGEQQGSGNGEQPGEGGQEPGDNDQYMTLEIAIGSATFTATLADNETAAAFRKLLPLTLNMTELNGNEKYAALAENLPTAHARPETIHSGDIMLYGSNTLVVFYKTFSTTYSYTRIGTVDDPAGLERALGMGGITVTFK